MRVFSSVYLLLLAYIITALVFWEIALQRQSGRIFYQEVMTLRSQLDSAANPALFSARYTALKRNRDVRTFQYAGEGSTFLVVIIIGALVVYNSLRRNMKLSRQQNNFMLSVTHELKSPIAAVKLNLQTLEKRKLEETQKLNLIDRCVREADRLNDLCNNILVASQLDGGAFKRANELVNLSELAEEAVVEYGNRYPFRLTEEIDAGVRVKGDKVMLQMVLNNLLENAIKYSPSERQVLLELKREVGRALLRVVDEGPGISEGEKKKVFNKFYRVGSEESRRSKGTGLGLYLVRKIVLQHKGAVAIKDNSPIGSIFEVMLPLAKK
jgi:signal transduction histidine kinase